VLGSRDRFNRIALVAEKYMNDAMSDQTKNRIFEMTNQTEKYQAIKLTIEKNIKKDYDVRNFDIEFVVGLLYPKIDAHVSAQINHLLKAPFNVHHDSMKLSVPLIDVVNFDVNSCITLDDLASAKTADPNQVKGKSRYSLGDYLRHFEAFCNELEKEDTEGENMEFDF